MMSRITALPCTTLNPHCCVAEEKLPHYCVLFVYRATCSDTPNSLRLLPRGANQALCAEVLVTGTEVVVVVALGVANCARRVTLGTG